MPAFLLRVLACKCWQLEAICSIVEALLERATINRAASSISPPAAGRLIAAGSVAAVGDYAILELKKRSLDIARARAEEAGLTNVRFHERDIAAYDEPFEIGVALHACGAASDLVLQKCAEAKARYVVCPCRLGKLGAPDRRDWYRFAATGDNDARDVPHLNRASNPAPNRKQLLGVRGGCERRQIIGGPTRAAASIGEALSSSRAPSPAPCAARSYVARLTRMP